MPLAICKECAKKELGELYNIIIKSNTTLFFGDCNVCNKYQFDDIYFIPVFSWDFYRPENRKFKNNLEVIKDFLIREKELISKEG